MKKSLDTFQLVNKDRVMSPILTTIRSYGEWFEGTFDSYTAAAELYMTSVKKSGERVLESHPGTRIGNFFDKIDVGKPTLKSWYVLKDSETMDKIKKLGLAEYRDAIPISVNDKERRQMIRLYTVEQIEFYIRSTLDTNFSIARYCLQPKQVKVRDTDVDKIIAPKIKEKRTKGLF